MSTTENFALLGIEALKKNECLISELQYDDKGNPIRLVNGTEIKQIEEKTEDDVKTNYLINLWRMRNV